MILELLNKRCSIRNFKNKNVSNDIINLVLEAGRLLPSGGNEQPWKFGVITDKELIECNWDIMLYCEHKQKEVFYMTLGEKLQQLRKSKGMSQEEFAEKLDVSRQSISEWELNDSVPDISKIVLISELFSVSTDYLLKEHENKTNHSGKSHIYAKILFITSVIFISIGLICAVAAWYEEQNLESVAGGMVIQIVGIASLLIGKAICSSENVPMIIKIANLALLIFMPVSIINSLIKGQPIRPYPLNPPELLLFLVSYSIVSAVGAVIIVTIERNKSKHF